MRILIIMLLSVKCFSQMPLDKKRHYLAGSLVTIGVGSLSYKITKKEGLSTWIGFSAGITVNALKEYLWDGILNKGIKSNEDMLAGSFGSAVGAVTFRVGLDIFLNKKNKIKLDYYNN